MLLVTIVLSILIKYASLECDIEITSPNKEYNDKLFEDIKCDYKSSEPPNKNSTTVAIKFILKNFYFDKNEVLFNIYSWMFFSWEDPRLKWNPNDYDGIDKVYMHSLYIWTPLDILHHMKEINENGDLNYETPHCQIMHTGRVKCVPRIIHTTYCNSKLNNWPYDIQTCTIKFHIKEGKKDNVTFTFNSTRGLSAFGAEYGSGWNIIDYETGENATGDTKIYLTFVVERQALGIAAVIVVPSIIVIVLILSSLLLDVKNNNRLGLAIFSLLINFYLLNGIVEIVPHQGYDSPSILYFIHSSIFITVCVICMIYTLSSLIHRQGSPNQWIISFNNYILNNYIITKVYKWQALSQTSSEEASDIEKWTNFTNIINNLFFFIILITYLILYFVYMPQPIPTD